jgi:hypothetical protein
MARCLHHSRPVTTAAIHRVIEQQAASRGDHAAVVESTVQGTSSLTYRELNQRGNALARRLMANGLRRGGHVWVVMPRGADLAVALLGILKAGGSYTWIDPDHADAPHPAGLSIVVGHVDNEEQYIHVETSHLLNDLTRAAGPNLPVITRGSDIACILRDAEGAPVILVPHEALTALRHGDVPHPASWSGEPGAMDLWMALMAGVTVAVEEKLPEAAAA